MEYLIDILIYFFVFVISALFVNGGLNVFKKNRLGLLLIMVGVLIPSIMAGIRYNVGADYPTYLKMYNNVVNGQEMYYRTIEPASTAIINLSAYLKNSVFMFFAFSFLTNAFFLFAFWRLFKNNSRQVAWAFFFYLCLLFSTTLNAMRSGVAISLCAVSFSFFLQDWTKKNFFFGLLFILFAYLFHFSALLALIFIPVFWLSKKHSGTLIRTRKIGLWILYFIIAMALPNLFELWGDSELLGDYSRYLNGFGGSFSIPLADIAIIGLIIWGIIYLYQDKNGNNLQKSILYCASFYVPFAVIVGWFTYVDGLSRLSFMLESLVVCMMSYMAVHPKRTGNLRDLATITVIIVATGLMFVRNLNWSVALPYKTVMENGVSYAAEN